MAHSLNKCWRKWLPCNCSFPSLDTRSFARPVLLLIGSGLLWLSPVHADKIYKWVDEHGQVHYGAKPPAADAPAEQVELSPSLSQKPEPDPGLRDRYERRDRLLEQFAEERAAERRVRAEAEAAEKKRQQECTQARKRLQIYRNSRYLYDETDAGERRILTSAERAIEENKAAAAMDELCR